MSHIILETSLACLTENKINRKANAKLIGIKLGNEYFWILMLYDSQILSWLEIQIKITHKHATEAFIYNRQTTHGAV